jgi:hypothetical protein
MAVLYCMGVGAIGAVLIGRVFETFMPWGGQGLFEFWFLIVSIIQQLSSSHITFYAGGSVI